MPLASDFRTNMSVTYKLHSSESGLEGGGHFSPIRLGVPYKQEVMCLPSKQGLPKAVDISLLSCCSVPAPPPPPRPVNSDSQNKTKNYKVAS